MKLFFVIVIFFLFITKTFQSQEKNIEYLITSMEKSYETVKDYSCKVYKKEWIDGQYFEKKNIIYKFMKPHYYYMKWLEGDNKGMEVIYAGKKYNNNIRVHLGGLMKIIDIEVDPLGSRAMNENRHNIFESDIGFIIKLFRKNYNLAKKKNINLFRFVGIRAVDNKKTHLYEAIFPDKMGFYSHKILMYISEDLELPVKLMVYDWDMKLIESYEFTDFIINNGFDLMEFDADNPKYDF